MYYKGFRPLTFCPSFGVVQGSKLEQFLFRPLFNILINAVDCQKVIITYWCYLFYMKDVDVELIAMSLQFPNIVFNMVAIIQFRINNNNLLIPLKLF